MVWGLGDYSPVSEMLRPAAVALADACAVSAGQEVLDVAAGDGNFALACAAEGASVVASDLSPGMVERGRARAAAEGYDVEWVEADAERLPFEDGRFDCVGSAFGAMIAPRPEVVARELFRVVRPGNTVGMTAWVAGGFSAESFAIARRFVPPPPGMHVPEEWGDEDTVRQRFDGLAASLSLERRSVVWRAESVEAGLRGFAQVGPQVAAREALPPEDYESLARETRDLVEQWNRATDGSLEIENEYLQIVARKRG